MSKELSLFANLSFAKNGASCADGPHRTKINVRGSNFVKNTALVTSSDTTLEMGAAGETFPGYALVRSLRAIACPSTPTNVVVTQVGTAGSTSYTYKIVAIGLGGVTSAATAGTLTTTGNATLNGSHYNHITWDAVTGAVSYDIYRTTSAGTPSSTGKIYNTDAVNTSFDDQGSAGDSASAPATAVPAGVADNTIVTFGDTTAYPVACKVGEFGLFRANVGNLHAITDTFPVIVEYTIFED